MRPDQWLVPSAKPTKAHSRCSALLLHPFHPRLVAIIPTFRFRYSKTSRRNVQPARPTGLHAWFYTGKARYSHCVSRPWVPSRPSAVHGLHAAQWDGVPWTAAAPGVRSGQPQRPRGGCGCLTQSSQNWCSPSAPGQPISNFRLSGTGRFQHSLVSLCQPRISAGSGARQGRPSARTSQSAF
jgi:hypothetical protein